MRFRLGREDALDLDNAAMLLVRCVERRPVVVIGDRNPDDPGSAGYYVTRALAPHNDARDRYLVTHFSRATVTEASLRGAAMVCVGDVDAVPPTLEAALRDYVEAGGSLLAFGGARPLRSDALLPWTLGSRLASAKLTQGDWAAPELSAFNAEAQDALGRTSLRRAWRVRGVHDEGRVLLSYSNGLPALASRPVGRGRVVAATFSPASNSSELGKYGVFVVLMQSLAEQLTAGPSDAGTAVAGRPLQITADTELDPQGAASVVESPTAQPLRDAVIGFAGDSAVATLPTADAVGFYTWRQGPAVVGEAAVNLDPREGDTRPIEADTLASAIARRGAGSATVAGVGQADDTLVLRGQPLWGWMLLGALVVLSVEMGVLGGWRR